MERAKPQTILAAGLAAVLLAVACGCHGRAGDSGAGAAAQAPSPGEVRAKQQAQLNNPRVSPMMKEMLRRQLEQPSSARQH